MSETSRGERLVVKVSLTCGHRWRESRPARMAAPVDGEPRACGHPEHYPQQFPAVDEPAVEHETEDGRT